MKIVLVALYDLFSHSIRGLHSHLENGGHDVFSVFFNVSTYTDGIYGEGQMVDTVKVILEQQPDYVGISVRSPLFPVFVDMATRIRAASSTAKIVAGGPHVIGAPETCLPYADHVVIGDGEPAFDAILRGGAAKIVYGGRYSGPYAMPYYGERSCLLHMGAPPVIDKKMSVYSTRGCHFASCTYCQESILGQRPARKPVHQVVAEIGMLRGMFPQVSVFTFADSIFLYDKAWLSDFAGAFSGSGLRFMCAACASMVDDEIVEIAQAAGVDTVRIGVQSGSERLRKDIYGRRDSLEEVLAAADILRRKGVLAHYDFIVDSPFDTPETLRDTRDFISKLPGGAWINKFELRYWPGTQIAKMALDKGYITEQDVEGNYMRLGGWTYTYRLVV